MYQKGEDKKMLFGKPKNQFTDQDIDSCDISFIFIYLFKGKGKKITNPFKPNIM
jgi:hypothetical protein